MGVVFRSPTFGRDRECTTERSEGRHDVMSYVYVLSSDKDGSYYVGSTKDIVARIKAHKSGKVKFTKSRLPVKLMFLKGFDSYSRAYLFERRVKSWKKRKSIEHMFNKDDRMHHPEQIGYTFFSRDFSMLEEDSLTDDFMKNLDKSFSILERDLKEAADFDIECTNEWCSAMESSIDELAKFIYSISEPRWLSDEDSEVIRDMRHRIHDLYARFKGISTRATR